MTFLLTSDARIGRTADGELAMEPVARVTMTCCGATITTDYGNAVELAQLIDGVHECVPLAG